MASNPPIHPMNQTKTPEWAMKAFKKLQGDLQYFSANCLRIKLKEGGDGPFIWNRAQEYLHARVESQLARIGKVRLFILKGRQQGISTYIAARGFHKSVFQKGHRTFILSHHPSTTGVLFEIVEMYYDNCPPAIKPGQDTNNNRVMEFSNKSKYTVSTAGSGQGGRGDTVQFFHWSEVAFSDNIAELLTGVCQTVPELPGTEKFHESTANGMGGMGRYFYTGCKAAMDDEDSDWELVFIPWYWQEEYTAPVKPNFQLTEEEQELQEQFGLTDGQLQWRRNKIKEFELEGEGPNKFKQEYPCSVTEAFQASGDHFIDPEAVARARKSSLISPHSPLVLGVDVGPVRDRNVITYRQGPHIKKVDILPAMDPMLLAGKLTRIFEKNHVVKCFIDVAEGRGVISRLKELGWEDVVVGVHFGEKPIDDKRYTNKRAEMAGEFRDWIQDPDGVRIPDDDRIALEIAVIPPFKETSNGKRQLISKDEIKKLNAGKSTDIFDSIMLTFAQPVRVDYNREKIRKDYSVKRSELASTNRRRTRPPSEYGQSDFDDEGPIGFSRRFPGFTRRR